MAGSANYTRVPFDRAHAGAVLGWVRSDSEARMWASLERAPNDPAVFDRFTADPDVEPWLLCDGEEPVAYGEVWRDGGEAELARILVSPGRRGQGIGRALAASLAERCTELGLRPVWVRVHPENEPAQAAYRAAGFVRAAPAAEAGFNAGQPSAYRWMCLDPA